MKAILFLCLALIVSYHTAAAITRAEIISLLQQDYTIDKVLQLFQALQAQEQSDVSDLDAAYNDEEPQLAAEIVRTTGLLNAKTSECDGIQDTLNGQTTERDNLQYDVNEASDTITSNNNKVSSLEDARCAANLLFIGRLQENQEAANFLTFLGNQISSSDFRDYLTSANGAFIQIKEALDHSKTDEILTLLAKHHLLSLLQQTDSSDESSETYQGENDLSDVYNVQARTSSQIGTGYVDNTQGAMEGVTITENENNVDDYISQLLGFINELLANFQSSTASLQQAEQQSVQALIDYKTQIDDQNYVLNAYITATTARIQELDGIISNNEEALSDCNGEVPPLEAGVEAAQNNHDTYVANYQSRRANLENTISLLGQVIQIYTDQVANVAGTEYRERTQDYLADQNFDQTSGFTARASVTEIASYHDSDESSESSYTESSD
jgi:hypothetical protein